MHPRDQLLVLLERYDPIDAEDRDTHARLTSFAKSSSDCLSRHHPPGHITASAWIVDEDRGAALLIHHRKLERWLQPGGHIEDDASVLAAARREVEEETGLRSVDVYSDQIFDLDIHPIPARKDEPAHLHYDVRFLFVADPAQSLELSEESHDLRWFTNAEVHAHGEGRSIDRMIEKALLTRRA